MEEKVIVFTNTYNMLTEIKDPLSQIIIILLLCLGILSLTIMTFVENKKQIKSFFERMIEKIRGREK